MANGFTTKSEMHQRMARDKTFTGYRDLREAYKRDNVSDRIAWKIAAALTEPPPGEPPYYILEPDLVEVAAKLLENGPPAPPPPPTNKSGSGIKFGPQSEPNPNATPEWNEHAAEVKEAPANYARKWAALYKKIEKGRVASELAIIKWAFDNAGTPPDEIDVETVPSRGALKFLEHIQHPANYSAFVKDVWSKIIPSRQQIEYDARRRDDGKEFFERLDALERTLEEEMEEADVDEVHGEFA